MQAGSRRLKNMAIEMQHSRTHHVQFGPNITWRRIATKGGAPRIPQDRVRAIVFRWLMQRQGGEQVNSGLAVHGAKPMVKNTMAVQNRTAAVKSKMALNIGGSLVGEITIWPRY